MLIQPYLFFEGAAKKPSSSTAAARRRGEMLMRMKDSRNLINWHGSARFREQGDARELSASATPS